MKKKITVAVALVLAVAMVTGGLFAAGVGAEGLPSSKAAAKVSELTLLTWEPEAPSETPPWEMDENIPDVDYEGNWTTILTQSIKTPNQKDLFIDVSLETGLYTRTLVRSKVKETAPLGDWDSSRAQAEIRVRVVIDEGPDQRIASPGSVVFDMRNQTLSAKFMGIFTSECFTFVPADPQIDNDGDGDINEDPPDGINNDPENDELIDEDWVDYVMVIDYDCLEPEELDLILHTLAASSFNFVIDQLSPGVHTVSVQAKIFANGEAEEGQYEAMAMVGKGSVVIEVVRMIQEAEWLID